MPNVTQYVVTVWQNLPNKSTPIESTKLNHIENGIKNATDFINTLDASAGIYLCGAPFTQELLNKLNGIEANANNYSLPAATPSTLGGVKIDNDTIIIENGVIRATVSGVSDLSDLDDVDLTGLEDGQILKYDADEQKWIPTSEAEVRTQLSQLTDVDLNNVQNGQTIKWNSTSEKWENADAGNELSYDDTIDVLGLPPNPIYRLKIATPVMTNYTLPSGEASASTTHASNYAWKAFTQNNDVDGWVGAQGQVTNQWLQYRFDVAKCITKIGITFRSKINYSVFEAFDLLASNDGTNWTTLGSFDNIPNTAGASYEYLLNNDNEYLYYRLSITDNGGYDVFVGLRCLNLYEKYLA